MVNLNDTWDKSLTLHTWTNLRDVILKQAQLLAGRAAYVIVEILASFSTTAYLRDFKVMIRMLILLEFKAPLEAGLSQLKAIGGLVERVL